MAEILAAKGPSETVERRWAVPVEDGDGVASVSISASGVTATAELDGNDVVLAISDGTAGSTASIVVTATTDQEFILADTLYIPIVAGDGAAITVQDVVSYALRKVTGLGETPDADQAADALEKLSDMLEEWRVTGADVGAPRPLTLSTVLYSPHSHISAIKNNLIVRLSDQYNREVTPSVAVAAVRGLQLIKTANQPISEAEYF